MAPHTRFKVFMNLLSEECLVGRWPRLHTHRTVAPKKTTGVAGGTPAAAVGWEANDLRQEPRRRLRSLFLLGRSEELDARIHRTRGVDRGRAVGSQRPLPPRAIRCKDRWVVAALARRLVGPGSCRRPAGFLESGGRLREVLKFRKGGVQTVVKRLRFPCSG